MAKAMTIQEKRERMEKELDRLTAFERIIEKLEGMLNYDYCDIKRDADGNLVENDDGEWVFVEPNEDAWNYKQFKAFKDAVEEIKELV